MKLVTSIKHGSDVHCPMEIGVKIFDFGGVIDEECHNWQRRNKSFLATTKNLFSSPVVAFLINDASNIRYFDSELHWAVNI